MKCIKCGYENQEGAGFCANCGNVLNANPQMPINNTKKNNVKIVIFVVVLIVFLIAIFLILNHNNKKKLKDDNQIQVNENTQNNERYENGKKEFSDDIILNHFTINGVKLTEINTIDDVLTKLNAEGAFVTLCYTDEAEKGCRGYANYQQDFITGNFDDKDLVSIIIYFELDDDKYLDFATYYNIYKKQKNDSPFYNISSIDENLLKLDDSYIEEWSMADLKNKYNLPYAKFYNYDYRYEFNSKDGDKFVFYGSYNSSQWSLSNRSIVERNR